jgi:hypothetical protein
MEYLVQEFKSSSQLSDVLAELLDPNSAELCMDMLGRRRLHLGMHAGNVRNATKRESAPGRSLPSIY